MLNATLPATGIATRNRSVTCAECFAGTDWCTCDKPLVLDVRTEKCTLVFRGGRMVAEVFCPASGEGLWIAFVSSRNVSARAAGELRGRRFATHDDAIEAVRAALAGA